MPEPKQYDDRPQNLTGGSPVREALVTLHKDLNQIMANEWSEIPSNEIKRRISFAMMRSLETAI